MGPGRRESDVRLSIVEADASVGEALCRLAGTAGFAARSFASIERFLAQVSPYAKGCVLLDGALLRGSMHLKAVLRSKGVDWPVIVLCASADEAARREARAFGAQFLLNKPVDAQALLDAIAWVTDENAVP